jgi:hypothetical protein
MTKNHAAAMTKSHAAAMPKNHAAAPFSVPEAKEMSQAPTHKLKAVRNRTLDLSARQTMDAWRNDVNNPKTESYRYGILHSVRLPLNTFQESKDGVMIMSAR